MKEKIKCVILAAGKGTRFTNSGFTAPKPLINFLGLPLIERVILNAYKTGIKEFIVVTGYQHQIVENFLSFLAERRKINIKTVFNPYWEKENGLSLLQTEKLFKKNENFLLLMCDHLFEPEILEKLITLSPVKDKILLAADYNLENPYVDPDDVTKVYSVKNKIINIGKKITKFNGYDTGIFLCTPVIFKAIKQSIKEKNDSTLSGAVRILASKNKAFTVDIDNHFWIDIDSPSMYKKAEKYFISKLKKPSDGPVSRYINRPVSLAISKFLVKTSITPNQITVISFLLSIIASLLFLAGKYIFLLIGGIISQISSIIDGCDGEIARLKYMQSDFGAWLDAVLDRYSDAFLIAGLTYYSYIISPSLYVFLTGFFAITGSFLNSYTADKYDAYMVKILKKKKYFRIGRDVRIFLIFLACIFNLPFYFIIFTAILMNFETIRRIFLLSKYDRKRI